MDKLEVGNPETFIGECEVMDLSELKDKVFLVAISSGAPTQCKYIQESIHGPYGFYEMVEQVDAMWKKYQHHARVIIPSQDMKKPPECLDACTLDYLEAKASEIIVEGMINGDDLVKEYTCKAGIFSAATNGLPQEPK
jgi:hypothetical protein